MACYVDILSRVVWRLDEWLIRDRNDAFIPTIVANPIVGSEEHYGSGPMPARKPIICTPRRGSRVRPGTHDGNVLGCLLGLLPRPLRHPLDVQLPKHPTHRNRKGGYLMCEAGYEHYMEDPKAGRHLDRRSLLVGGVVALGSTLIAAPSNATPKRPTTSGPSAGPAVPAAASKTPKVTADGTDSTVAPTPVSSGAVPLATETYGLTIRPRSSWAEGLAAKGPINRETDVRFLLVHHTASPNTYSEAGIPALLRGFFRFHTGPEKGWPDVAYNFFVDRFGGVWEGRTGSLNGWVAGSATGGNQGFSQLVCLIGDFTNSPPTKAQEQSLTKLLAALADRHRISTGPGATVRFISRGSNRQKKGVEVETLTINGHRSMSLTSCPGDSAFARLPAIRVAVQELRANS